MEKKEKKKNGILYRIVMVILIAIIAFSLYKIGTIIYGYYKGMNQYNQAQQVAGVGDTFTGEVDFSKLMDVNEDIKAWIYSEGTTINYPVVQGPDNDYYLYRMFNGEYNGAGSIFIDYRNDDPFNEFNTVLHGHRMKDGTMFKSLIEYRDMDFYNQHKVMQITTPDTYYDLQIFAVVTIPADSDLYRFEFLDDDAKRNYINKIQEINEIKTNVSVTEQDRIVMMSTCTFEFDDARLCVYGKLAKTGDREEE